VQFALLNNDCLWVPDEVQLMGIGAKTAAQLQGLREKLGTYGPVKTLWMSATLDESVVKTVDHAVELDGRRLGLSEGDRQGVLKDRFQAAKRLQPARTSLDAQKYASDLAAEIIEQHQPDSLTLVVCNRVSRAQDVYRALLKYEQVKKETWLVHSRFRAGDRQKLNQFLLSDNPTGIVVATQAIEAEIDLSARVLFAELAPRSSLVQRFGRCNRTGKETEAQIFWIDIPDPKSKTGKSKTGKNLAIPYDTEELQRGREFLEALQKNGGDAGPQSLAKITPELAQPIPGQIPRRRDIEQLFDTSVDLAGHDIDVSRFIRQSEDLDVAIAWRSWEGGKPPADSPRLAAEELCRVSIGQAKPKPAVEALRTSRCKRLELYRETFAQAQAILDGLDLPDKLKDEDKQRLVAALREQLPDPVLPWIDTCIVLANEKLGWPALMLTGGNNGNLDYSREFAGAIDRVIDPQSGSPTPKAAALLRCALFDEQATPAVLTSDGLLGHFSPLVSGGHNAGPGFFGGSRVNPWDIIFALEGSVLLASSVTRACEQAAGAAFPFMVKSSAAAFASASRREKTKDELWLPLWSRPASLDELLVFFGEGRAKVGDRPVRTGIDMFRALAGLGVQRGVTQFARYLTLERHGQMSYAVAAGYYKPQRQMAADRLSEIDAWLDRFRCLAADEKTPGAIASAHRQLEEAIVRLATGKGTLLDVLIELGAAEAVLSRSRRFLQDEQRGDKIQPLPLLSAGWLRDCWQDEPEFRLAAVLAGVGLRERLVAVRPDSSDRQGRRRVWLAQQDNRTIWTGRSLEDNLLAWVQRQLVEEQRDDRQPSDRPARVKASLDDLRAWLEGRLDEARLEAIARGLCLVAVPERAFASKLPWLPAELIAVALVHHRQLPLGNGKVLPYVPRLVASLAAGRGDTAIALALQRLRASGLKPAIEAKRLPGCSRDIPARRIGAALAFPLSVADQDRLLQSIQRHE